MPKRAILCTRNIYKIQFGFCSDVLFLNDLGFDQLSIEPVVLKPESPMSIREQDLPRIIAEYDKLAEEYIARRKTDKWFNFSIL